MSTQPELFPDRDATPEEVEDFLDTLETHGPLTRRQLGELRGWPERKVRHLASIAGDTVVKGPKGFCLTAWALRHGLADYVHRVAQIRESQAKKDLAYAVGLRRQLHAHIH